MEASQDVCYLVCRRFLSQNKRKDEKKNDCNRCTVDVNVNFVPILKESILGTRLRSNIFFVCIS